MMLKSASIETPLGTMTAIADEQWLYFLSFQDAPKKQQAIKQLSMRTQSTIASGRTALIDAVERELDTYFKGKLKSFNIPHKLLGTTFQKQVWQMLKTIPLGKTYSYEALATAIGHPAACRAAANANAHNPLTLIVPCHRVINKNGKLGGYGGKVHRKLWLLEHEGAWP